MGLIKLIPAIIVLVLILVLLFVLYVVRKSKLAPDYYGYFVIGLIWVIAGMPFMNYWLSGMGFLFMIIGLLHQDKWKKNKVKWSKLSKKEKKTRKRLMITLGVLLLIFVVSLITLTLKFF